MNPKLRKTQIYKEDLNKTGKAVFIYLGEFGYEISYAYPQICGLRQLYEDVTVCSFDGMFPLYKDLDVKFISNDQGHHRFAYEGSDGNHLYKEMIAKFDGYDVYTPFHNNESLLKIRKEIRTDIQVEKRKKISLHLRLFKEDPNVTFFTKEGVSQPKEYQKKGRNWREELNTAIHLLQSFGFEVVTIGHPDLAVAIDGVDDARSTDLEDAIVHIKESVLLIGPSSGPSALAQWCRVPVLYWFLLDQDWFNENKIWNPFGVKSFTPWDFTNDAYNKWESPTLIELKKAVTAISRMYDNGELSEPSVILQENNHRYHVPNT